MGRYAVCAGMAYILALHLCSGESRTYNGPARTVEGRDLDLERGLCKCGNEYGIGPIRTRYRICKYCDTGRLNFVNGTVMN